MLFLAVTYWEPADRRCASTVTTDTVDSSSPLGLREISCTRLAVRDREDMRRPDMLVKRGRSGSVIRPDQTVLVYRVIGDGQEVILPVEECVEEGAEEQVLVFGEGFILVIELGIVEHGDQVTEGVAEQLEHLELWGRGGLVGGEEVEEALEAAGGAEAVEEEPEGPQEQVAETEAVERVW